MRTQFTAVVTQPYKAGTIALSSSYMGKLRQKVTAGSSVQASELQNLQTFFFLSLLFL